LASTSWTSRRSAARYVYFGLAPSTDIVIDLVFDEIVDRLLDFAKSHTTLPLSEGLEKELAEALAKLGLKGIADKIKKAGELGLIPPFPFREFTVATLPMAGLFFVGLDNFQGAFSVERSGGTLNVTFDDGIAGPVASNTIPRFIPLQTGATASASMRFGLIGVIAKGADIPFET